MDLRQVVKDLEKERSELAAKLATLDSALAIVNGLTGIHTVPKREHKHRVSTASRRRMARGQKMRWAKLRQKRLEKRKKLHWTQKPENRARALKLIKKMNKLKRAA